MRFNTVNSGSMQVKNYEGEKAFRLDPAMELYTAVVTWSVSDSFYEKDNDRLLRVRKPVAENDPLFVARLAVYTRHKMYMRSAPLVLLTELARVHSGDDLVSKATAKVIGQVSYERVSYPHIRKVAGQLSAPEKVANAKQFPFRYLAAYRELLAMSLPAGKGSLSEKLKSLFTGPPSRFACRSLHN